MEREVQEAGRNSDFAVNNVLISAQRLSGTAVETRSCNRPLGMLESVKLSRVDEARLKLLNDYDLTVVANRIKRKQTLPENLIDTSVTEFKRLMALYVLGHRGITVPCEEVDEVWHTFILFTMEYTEFCRQVAGSYLHHLPADSNTKPAHPKEAFVPLYTKYFGSSFDNEVQQKYTAKSADCGGGCQGCDDCGVA